MAWGKPQGIDDIVERLIKNDTTLKSLYLMRHRRFNEEDALALSTALSRNTTLVELNLSSHTISTRVAKILVSGLQSNDSIEYVSVGNSQFGDDAMVEFCACLQGNQRIKTLDIERKGITQRSASALCTAIQESKSVKSLILSNNELNEGLVQISPCISGLESLEMHNCGLQHHLASEAIGKGLARALSLKKLELDGNCLENINAEILSQGLKGCTSLEALSLNANPLGPEGVRTVAYALPEKIQRLDLGSTQASCDGVLSIAECISQGRLPNLEYLNICNCEADASGISKILDAICKSGNVQASLSLDAGANVLGKEYDCLFKSVIDCRRLKSLRLHACNLGIAGAEALTQCLDNHAAQGSFEGHQLSDLDISGNDIDEKSMLGILKSLTPAVSNTFANLTTLIIAANPDVEGHAIAEVVESLALHETAKQVVIIRAASDSSKKS